MAWYSIKFHSCHVLIKIFHKADAEYMHDLDPNQYS